LYTLLNYGILKVYYFMLAIHLIAILLESNKIYDKCIESFWGRKYTQKNISVAY